MNEGLFDKIFSAAAGIWTLVALAFIAFAKSWPGILERRNERQRDAAAEKADDWARIRDEVDRLSKRVAALEEQVEECQKDRDEWRGRAIAAETENIRLEAYHLGVGEGKQVAQVILSAERNGDMGDGE